ncbi:MAG: hypothetical protein ACRBG0_19100 [Lewinella sp.]|uniref:hypothetical protein n=1 Tax=Lewinella sp. TaxID=2004506 RepID=UPI003D6C0EDA
MLVIPQVVYDHFGGEIVHPSKSARLKASQDPDGDWILSTQVLDDPDWDFLDAVEIEGKKLDEYFSIKNYKYVEEEV